MKRFLTCDCGYRLVNEDVEALVARARTHARAAHGIELSERQVAGLLRPAPEDLIQEPEDGGGRDV